MDSEGNAIVVWQQSDGYRINIYSSRYTKSGGWESAELIEHYDENNALSPKIAIDNEGNAISVWQHNDFYVGLQIFANRYTKDQGWGTIKQLETAAGYASSPTIAFDGNGNAMAVWSQISGVYNIYSNRYNASTNQWEGAQLIESDDTGDANSPRIAFDKDNNAIAVWRQEISSVYSIYSNRYIDDFIWEFEDPIETDDTGPARFPRIAFDPMGNAIAVWQQEDGVGDSHIWANRYTYSGNWGVAELIQTNVTEEGYKPEIAFDSQGNAIAVWMQHDGSTENIWANYYTAGDDWGTAELLETDNSGNAAYPFIKFDSNDDAIVVWYQSDGTVNSAYSRRYKKDSGWQEIELLEESSEYMPNHSQVKITTDNDGNAIAVWVQSHNLEYSIYAACYK